MFAWSACCNLSAISTVSPCPPASTTNWPLLQLPSSPVTWHLHRTFQATIYHSYKESLFSPVLPPTFWPHLISHCLLVSPYPRCNPLPCFPGCLLYDEVHILRDSGSHLHFSLSPLFGVSVEINAGPGSTEGRETHSQRKRITGRGGKDYRKTGGWHMDFQLQYTHELEWARKRKHDLLHGFY